MPLMSELELCTGRQAKLYCCMQVLLMSDELKLDEVYCLLCLLTSHEEVIYHSFLLSECSRSLCK